MSYRYRKSSRKYRKWDNSDWYVYHKDQRQKISDYYGGIDDDIKKIFFSLSKSMLHVIFMDYEAEHGKSKRKYAESTYANWKDGSVNMSGEVAERLINILPKYLSFDQKFELIKKVWINLSRIDTFSVGVPSNVSRHEFDRLIKDAFARSNNQNMPELVRNRLKWLSLNDAKVANDLIIAFREYEKHILLNELTSNFSKLLSTTNLLEGNFSANGRCVVKLPSCVIELYTISPSKRSNIDMTTNSNNDHNRNDLSNLNESFDVSNYSSPKNILDESLKHLPKEKAQEIIAKAAEESLRLQIKKKESKDDQEIVKSKLDDAANAAHKLSSIDKTQFRYSTQHSSEHGTTTVNIESKKKLSESCFVATWCYEDELHPNVVELRNFRDRVLEQSYLGTAFIKYYYTISPHIVKILKYTKFPRYFIKVPLDIIVKLIK